MTSALTPVSARPVRGVRPSFFSFDSTSAAVRDSLKPSSGWRRIVSPTSMISSAWRSIASSTRRFSSSRVTLVLPSLRAWRRICRTRPSTRGNPELRRRPGRVAMKAAAAVAEILKREGVKFLIGYPVNPIIEAAAEADIRTIIVRQERTGLHMADAVSRISSGERVGVFAMQHGPGSENAFGGVAQAYGDSVPIVVLPGGYPRRITNIQPDFNSFLNFQHVTQWGEQVMVPRAV